MNVQELIARLQRLDPGAEVRFTETFLTTERGAEPGERHDCGPEWGAPIFDVMEIDGEDVPVAGSKIVLVRGEEIVKVPGFHFLPFEDEEGNQPSYLAGDLDDDDDDDDDDVVEFEDEDDDVAPFEDEDDEEEGCGECSSCRQVAFMEAITRVAEEIFGGSPSPEDTENIITVLLTFARGLSFDGREMDEALFGRALLVADLVMRPENILAAAGGPTPPPATDAN